MKKKESFVTNSSSCSFVMIAKKVTIDEIDFSKDNISTIDSCEGPSDINDIETAEKYKDNLWKVYFYQTFDECSEFSFVNLDLPKEEGLKLISGVQAC